MAFDQTTRKLLENFVAAARRSLVTEFTRQLQRDYGMDPETAEISDLARLTQLDDSGRHTASLLRETHQHYLAAGPAGGAKETLRRIVREQAFTVLNRLCALRMVEARDFLIESMGNGYQSKGFQLYLHLAGTALGETGDAYRCYLFSLFDEFSIDLPALFDRYSPMGRLFPKPEALISGNPSHPGIVDLINGPDIASLWTEDETIGWIYQYFNTKEERKAMRDASAAPSNSRELAVRNQFFTPRYIVEFLTDNTLGRTWCEMRKGVTALKDECRYLVRRPNEVFLAPGENAPTENVSEAELSQADLLRMPAYIEHRPKKDPRDLKVLDPACGSGHFLLYAFDLLERIYEEAWDDLESPKSETSGCTLKEDYPTANDLRRNVPELVLRWNLHGIDIDHRAVQIAALALWLRAQKSWQKLGIKTGERLGIAKSNIVTAEPMPGEEDMRREFTSSLKPRVIGQLVDVVFEKMKFAGEAGSLLKIEEEIKDSIAEARRQWLHVPKPEQKLLFSGMAIPQLKQMALQFDLTGVTDEQFWEQAEERILKALKDYAEGVENGRSVRRRLFAEDAERGFAFIDLCRKRYDVVLMNPPFGDAHERTVDLIDRSYLDWNGNLLCAFISRAGLLSARGFSGVVYDRTANIKNTYENFRKRYLLNTESSLRAIVDLGWDVLEANVEVSAGVISNGLASIPPLTWGCNLTMAGRNEKEVILLNATTCEKKTPANTVLTHSLLSLPNSVIGYYFKDFLIRIFEHFPSLAESHLKVFNGHTIKSDEYFRYWWEPECSRLKGKYPDWARLYNGGAYSRYYSPETDVVYYGKEGSLIRNHASTIFRNLGLQQQPGIAFGKRGEFIDAQILREGFVSTVEGQACSVKSTDNAYVGLVVLNSLIFQYGINAYCGQHKYPGYVNLFPFPHISNTHIRNASVMCKDLVDAKRECSTYDESAPVFVSVLGRLSDIAAFISFTSRMIALVAELHDKINEECYAAYDLIPADMAIIREYGKSEPEDRIWDDESGLPSEHVVFQRVISYYAGCIFGRWDVRISSDPSLSPKLPGPFDPLPVCPPGMLIGPDGLPAANGHIVSQAWMRARPDANTMPAEGSVKDPTITDAEYPLRISWGGILVDDPGFGGGQPHREDIVHRLRDVFDLLWNDQAHEVEQEACKFLGVSDLREYFHRPSGFFQDHLKRYSKSRRQAPIYWPLSTASGSYSLWIYYHRFTDQTLYRCINDYVEPKLKQVADDVARLRTKSGRSRKEEKTLEELIDLEAELRDFREELLRIAKFWKPNLNDGVQITAAPLWKLFRHKPWQKTLKETWEKMKNEVYNWAHLAFSIWPERVIRASHKDRSLSIAHGLEGDLWEEVEVGVDRQGNPKTKWMPKKIDEMAMKTLVQDIMRRSNVDGTFSVIQ